MEKLEHCSEKAFKFWEEKGFDKCCQTISEYQSSQLNQVTQNNEIFDKNIIHQFISERSFGLMHNYIISYFMAHGSSLPWKWNDLFLHSSEQNNDIRYTLAFDPKDYSESSIEGLLAFLGNFTFYAWYNLAFIQVYKGFMQKAYLICKVLVENYLDQILSEDIYLSIKIAFLYIYIIMELKTNYYVVVENILKKLSGFLIKKDGTIF